jgi:hypothetical protein
MAGEIFERFGGKARTGQRSEIAWAQMPNYLADSDIRVVLESGFAIPSDLDPAEVARLEEFIRRDQVLETFYRRRELPTHRPPAPDLSAAASAAMAAYDQRSERLSVGWQKLLVLQAGIAGSEQNLDSYEIQEWAYARITEDNPGWLGDFDDDVDRDMPLRWLTQSIGVDVLLARQRMAAPSTEAVGKAANGGCAVAALGALSVVAAAVWLM